MAMNRRVSAPRPPIGAASSRDYTQPPPGGAHYPWEPGGGSRTPGVPDNWQQFYPNEQEGRGDAWIGPKKAQLNAEHPPSSYQNMGSARDRMSPDDFRKWQANQIFTGDTWPTNNRSPSGQPGPNWDPRNPPPGSPSIPDWFRQHPDPMAGQGAPGQSPAPPARPGTAIHQPGQPPPTGAGSAQAWSNLAASTRPQPGPAGYTAQPGEQVHQNKNGAWISGYGKNRKRISDRAGNLLGGEGTPAGPAAQPGQYHTLPAQVSGPGSTAGGGPAPQQFQSLVGWTNPQAQRPQFQPSMGGGYSPDPGFSLPSNFSPSFYGGGGMGSGFGGGLPPGFDSGVQYGNSGGLSMISPDMGRGGGGGGGLSMIPPIMRGGMDIQSMPAGGGLTAGPGGGGAYGNAMTMNPDGSFSPYGAGWGGGGGLTAGPADPGSMGNGFAGGPPPNLPPGAYGRNPNEMMYS